MATQNSKLRCCGALLKHFARSGVSDDGAPTGLLCAVPYGDNMKIAVF